MKALCLGLVLLVCFFWGFTAEAQGPVVVELFTSEGCSSCPPADALLVQLSKMKAPNGAELIVLGEHVDYWNYIGWTDRFSSDIFTNRQQHYADHFRLASPYTPQMVIDGIIQFVGNDKDKVSHAILQESQNPRPATISLQLEGEKAVHITAHLAGVKKAHVFVAITEDGLTTNVARGENSGRTLRHAGVVRNLNSIGEIRDGEFDKTIKVPIEQDWNAANLKVVAWVQEAAYGPILGAASIPLTQPRQAAANISPR
jgi:hypothetical protein